MFTTNILFYLWYYAIMVRHVRDNIVHTVKNQIRFLFLVYKMLVEILLNFCQHLTTKILSKYIIISDSLSTFKSIQNQFNPGDITTKIQNNFIKATT